MAGKMETMLAKMSIISQMLGDFYLVSLDGVISMAPHISPFLFWQTRG
jgi:hypothetical protein